MPGQQTSDSPEVSVVMPCLNEAETLAVCIQKARDCLAENGVSGDIIIADDDGVVVVARHEAADVLKKSQEREANEESKRKRLAAGELGLDIYKMRERLAERGLKYIDQKDYLKS